MRWLFTLGLTVALTVFAAAAGADLPVQDGDFGCIDKAKAESYVSAFGINIESFGGLELCDPSVDSKKLFNDLRLVEEGRFAGNQENLFIRNFVDRDNYFNWLRGETRGIERGSGIPYATAYNSGGYFTMQDGWAKLSTLGRVGTVIHEARHTEGYGHVTCNHGPYMDTWVSGCDRSVEGAGSHSIEMEYYARVVVQGANFHPVYREMARLMLLARSNFVFNTNPLTAKDTLVARTDDGVIEFHDGERRDRAWVAAPPAAAPDIHLKRTSFGASLWLAPGQALAIAPVGGDHADLQSDDYSYFKLLKMTPPASLLDFDEVDEGPRRFVVALDANGGIYNYEFEAGAWSRTGALTGASRLATTDPDGREGVFPVSTDGGYCNLDLTTWKCPAAPRAWPAGAVQFARFQNETLELNNNGEVLGADGRPWPGLEGVRVRDLVKIPAYDVFESDLNF